MGIETGNYREVWNATALQFSGAFFGLALTLIGFAEARAQQPSDLAPPPETLLPGIEFLPTTYLWFPWVSAGIHPSNSRLPSASTTIGPGDLYGHLTWVPFMGQAEFRAGPFGIITDYIHAPLKAGITTRNILFGNGSKNFTLNTGSAVFLYRGLSLPNQTADVGLGVRAWGLGGRIALGELALPSVEIANGLSWADPLIVARYHHDFGNGFAATAYGDLGGFGLGAHFDWQLLGTIDYELRPGLDLHVGFRSLNFSYSAPRANINMNFNGPIISATFRF